MARGVWTRRWIAASGGVLVNGLILGALVLIEEPPPVVGEQPVIILALERPQKRASPQRRASAGARSANSARATRSTASEGEGPPALAAPEAPPAHTVDPQWTVDPKVVDRWRLLEGNVSMGIGRYKRACPGLSSEHLTPDEKERCIASWQDRPDSRRPSPSFIGPVDETKWEEHRRAPKTQSIYDKEVARKQHCRDYRRGRTPGFSERNLSSTGRPPPTLRERGCF